MSNSKTGREKRWFYIPQLDCLRFFCFLLVFLHHNLDPNERTMGHAYYTFMKILRDTGGFGLSLFFFLSSYLITSLLMMERDRTGTVDLSAFYVRRVLRIWPLYFAFLALVALLGIWIPDQHAGAARLAAMSLLVGNWFNIFHGMGPSVLRPLWSISVEEQFYLVWPGIFRSITRRRFGWFVAAVGLVSVGSTGWLAAHGWASLDMWLNSASEAIFFAAGAALALWLSGEVKSNLPLSAGLTLAGGAMWVLAEIFGHVRDEGSPPTPGHEMAGYVLVATGCALLLLGFRMFPQDKVPGWLIYLGKISYGLYVFHSLAQFVVGTTGHRLIARVHGSGMPLTLLSTIVMAALSYQFLERPFLRLKRRFELVKTRTA